MYALLGEGYGSGLPLGFLLIQNKGGQEGGTQRCLEQFIGYFYDRLETILFGHTDKNMPEINAFRAVLRAAKHQLCFWHALRAIKTRLSILRRQPAHYDVDSARAEFDFIAADFLPKRQRDGDAAPVEAAAVRIPTIRVRLNGALVARPVPGFRIRVPPRAPPARRLHNIVSTSHATAPRAPATTSGSGPSDDELEDAASAPEPEECDDEFDEQLTRIIEGREDEVDDEDGQDWLFEQGETRAADPAYVFCPAPHRPQLLRLFTKHFVQHPLLPEPDQVQQRSGSEIRRRAVHEMYMFCTERNLTEVWAYMWTSWYSTKMWPLWALSASDRIPRLRTTMTTENLWKQLKHNWLHHLLHPRLDQLLYIICSQLIPAYMHRANILEDDFRSGWSKPLTNYQRYFKGAWRKLATATITGRVYATNIATWQCNCGAQRFSPHLLCKHLVQAVPPPTPEFFMHIHRRRTLPFYQHPQIHAAGEPERPWISADDGSVTDGDDHLWNGHSAALATEDWRAWKEGRAAEQERSKRKRTGSPCSTWSLGTLDDGASYASSAEVMGLDADEVADEVRCVSLPISAG